MDNTATSILFLEKVFFKRRNKSDLLRGVELFNLRLLQTLSENGCKLTIPCHGTWAEAIASYASTSATVRPVRCALHPSISPIAAAVRERLTRSRYDCIILGNVGNGIIPALRIVAACAKKVIVIAHRMPSVKFLRGVRQMPGHIVCVNSIIADAFTSFGVAANVATDYGIFDADAFFPSDAQKPSDAPINFCVLGALDNAWKGADTALSALAALPADVRSRTRLHLASYSKLPTSLPDGATAYTWMSAQSIAEFLRGMDAMLVPSRDEVVMRETFSQATVQGMLSALPVLHSPLPILREKFDRGGGIECATAEDFARAMQQIVSSCQLRRRLGQEARSTALERYVWSTKRFVERYIAEKSV